jgi:hypothetical protein
MLKRKISPSRIIFGGEICEAEKLGQVNRNYLFEIFAHSKSNAGHHLYSFPFLTLSISWLWASLVLDAPRFRKSLNT